jgi:ketosteroid isomerase-like protein
MRSVLIALAVTLVAAGQTPAAAQTPASPKNDVLAVVRQFVNDFNKGDGKSAVAACADQAAIIDEFPPYAWHGAGACAKWMSDYDADARQNGITDGIVTLGAPSHVDVTGDRAYVVIPSDYAFKRKGTPVKETGSMFTFALQKGAAGWRIVGWTWAKK